MSDPTPPISYTFEVPARPPVYIVAPRPRRPYWLHILLLLVTLFTTLVVGARLQYNFLHNLPAFSDESVVLPLFHLKWLVQRPAELLLGIPFSMTLMGILLAHEFGHFIVAKRNGVYATLPYFIPAPTLIGTFGAVIRIKSPIRSRQALFDIGIAGPIAGFLVALPVLFWGLALSKPMPPEARRLGAKPWLSPRLQPRTPRFGATHAARGCAGQFVSAPGRNCSLGWDVCHRAKPLARWTTRRRPYHLRGGAASSQMGDASQYSRAHTVWASFSGRDGWFGR